MLVVGPNSTCDVCLECYTNGVNIPHAINCGHVFCQKCLEHLVQHKCPLCRTRFSPQEVRRLHVDRDPNVKAIVEEEPAQPAPAAPVEDEEAQRLLNEIAQIVKQGAKLHEIRSVIDECRAYYKSQGDHYTPVRVSCLLLHNLAESQRRLSLQAEELKGLRAERDDIRERLSAELEAAELRYEDLQRTSEEDKQTLVAKEKSLRDHYDEMNQSWLCEVLALERERDSLKQALDRMYMSQPEYSKRSVDLGYFYSVDPKRSPPGMEDVSMLKKSCMKQKILDEDDLDFHLSPLPDVSAPLASTLQAFTALADESDDEDLKNKKRKKRISVEETALDLVENVDESCVETPLAYPMRQPHTTEPIAIPSRACLAHQPSGSVAMSITADHWPSAIASSRPREDVIMSSRPPSPCRRRSSDRYSPPHAPREREPYPRDFSEPRRREPEPASEDAWQIVASGVSKLRDLLDSPQTSSLPPPPPSRSEIPRSSTVCLSRPTVLSRPSVPTRPSSASTHPGSSSLSTCIDDPYFVPTERRPLVSASEAAMQLERERQEKERRRQREASSAAPVPSTLKDATNVPATSAPYHHHRYKYGNDNKMKPVHPTPGTACV
ncbi:hypothetical protein ID866_7349 [Astraeus odoratus]|nr:hypothetical protein ID866_7349 [Astraeus odoratus]